MPLYGQSPQSLQGKHNVTDDGVRQGEMKDQVVNVGSPASLRSGQTDI